MILLKVDGSLQICCDYHIKLQTRNNCFYMNEVLLYRLDLVYVDTCLPFSELS